MADSFLESFTYTFVFQNAATSVTRKSITVKEIMVYTYTSQTHTVN